MYEGDGHTALTDGGGDSLDWPVRSAAARARATGGSESGAPLPELRRWLLRLPGSVEAPNP
jgi:hypothetical protein